MFRLYPMLVILFIFTTVVVADDGGGGDGLYDKLGEIAAQVMPAFHSITPYFERSTTQYLAQSLTVSDYIISAAVPIDCISTAISAIRVAGSPWLKALIRRNTETTAAVELELMSSTTEVCEVYDGKGVVRRVGAGLVWEFIVLYRGKQLPKNAVNKVMSMSEALAGGYMDSFSNTSPGLWQKARALLPLSSIRQSNDDFELGSRENINSQQNEIAIVANIRPESPNISHNRSDNLRTAGPYYACAGVLLQVALLVFAGFITYHDLGQTVITYDLPLYVAATVVLMFGSGIHTYIVGSSTKKECFRPAKDWAARMAWLQREGTLGDQEFKTTALFTGEDQRIIVNSSRHNNQSQDRDKTVWTITGLILTVVGLVAQAVGIMRLHRSVPIAYMAAALFMVALRAWIRRGRTNPIFPESVPSGFELEWITNTLRDAQNAPWMKDRNEITSGPLNILTNTPEVSSDNSPDLPDAEEAQRCTELRQSLAKVVNRKSSVYQEALQLTQAVEAAMDQLHSSCDCKEFIWADKVQMGQSKELEVKFSVRRQHDGKWKADAEQVEAALSLKVFSATIGSQAQPSSDSIDSTGGELALQRDMPSKRIRILGPRTYSLLQHLSWWIPAEDPQIRVGKAKFVTAEENDHQIGGEDQQSHTVEITDEFETRESNVLGFDPRRGGSLGSGQAAADAASLPPGGRPNSVEGPRLPCQSLAQSLTSVSEGSFSENGGPACTEGHLEHNAALPCADQSMVFSCPVQLPSPYSPNSGHGKWKFKTSRSEDLQGLGEHSDSVLFIESSDPLPAFYAKDMLATFLWAAMEPLLAPVQGTTSARVPESSDIRLLEQQLCLRNSFIDRLAQAIHSSGFLSEFDAYLSIILPLSIQNKLPNAPSQSNS